MYYEPEIAKLAETLKLLDEELNPPPTEETDIEANSKSKLACDIVNKTLSRDGKYFGWSEWEYLTCLTLGKYSPADIRKWDYKTVIKTSLLLRINQYLSG